MSETVGAEKEGESASEGAIPADPWAQLRLGDVTPILSGKACPEGRLTSRKKERANGFLPAGLGIWLEEAIVARTEKSTDFDFRVYM